jgi:hypothetical protein
VTQALTMVHGSNPNLIPEKTYQSLLEINGKVAQGVIHANNILVKTPQNFTKDMKSQLYSEINPLLTELSTIDLGQTNNADLKALITQVQALESSVQFIINLSK